MALRHWIRGPCDSNRFSRFEGLYCPYCVTDEALIIDRETEDVCCSFCGAVVNQENDLEQDCIERFDQTNGRVATFGVDSNAVLSTSPMPGKSTFMHVDSQDRWMFEYERLVKSLCDQTDLPDMVLSQSIQWGRRAYAEKVHQRLGKFAIAIACVMTVANAYSRITPLETLLRCVLCNTDPSTLAKKVKTVQKWIQATDSSLDALANRNKQDLMPTASTILERLGISQNSKPFVEKSKGEHVWMLQTLAGKMANGLMECPNIGALHGATLCSIGCFVTLVCHEPEMCTGTAWELNLLKRIAAAAGVKHIDTILSQMNKAAEYPSLWIPQEKDRTRFLQVLQILSGGKSK